MIIGIQLVLLLLLLLTLVEFMRGLYDQGVKLICQYRNLDDNID